MEFKQSQSERDSALLEAKGLREALEWAMSLIPPSVYTRGGGYAGPLCAYCSGEERFKANAKPDSHSKDCKWRIAAEKLVGK